MANINYPWLFRLKMTLQTSSESLFVEQVLSMLHLELDRIFEAFYFYTLFFSQHVFCDRLWMFYTALLTIL